MRNVRLGVSGALLLAAGAAADPASERLHRDAIVIDGHNDVTSWILDYGFDLGMDGGDPEKTSAAAYWVLGWLLPEPSGDEIRTHTDLARLQQGGVDAQFFSIWAHSDYAETPGASRERANAMIDALSSSSGATRSGSSSRRAPMTSAASLPRAGSPR